MSVRAWCYLSLKSTDVSTNTAVVRYEVYAETSGDSQSGYTKTCTVNVDGHVDEGYTTLPANTVVTCFDKNITISNASGKTITGSYSFPTGLSSGTLTGSTSMTLPVIAEASQPSCITWPNTTQNVGYLGDTITIHMNRKSTSYTHKVTYSFGGKSGTIATDVTDNCQWTIPYNLTSEISGTSGSGTIYAETFNGSTSVGTKSVSFTVNVPKATISNAPNIDHGSSLTITYSNPKSLTLQIGLFRTDGSTALAAYRNCTGTSYTFNFTDSELDTIYKQYGNNSSFNARVYVKTLNKYLDYKQITITLKGNQKTIREKVSGAWKRGKAFIKVNGTWKKGVIWQKVNGTWKRGI